MRLEDLGLIGNCQFSALIERTGEVVWCCLPRFVLDHIQAAFSPLGLLSEDYETTSLRMWGSFPQAYSHAGPILAAFAASPRWAEIL